MANTREKLAAEIGGTRFARRTPPRRGLVHVQKKLFPRRGASIIIALAGERSLNRTPQRQRPIIGKEPRSAQTRTAPHIVAERTASHKEARLRHHGFSTSLRLAPRTPRTSAPMRCARSATFRTPSCRGLAFFLFSDRDGSAWTRTSPKIGEDRTLRNRWPDIRSKAGDAFLRLTGS